MNTLSHDQLADLTTRALQSIAFILADRVDAQPQVLANASIAARVECSGHACGSLTVSADKPSAAFIAAGLLGQEPADIQSTQAGVDAVRELANIIAGSVAAQLGAENHPVGLSIPADTIPPSDIDSTCCLNCEGHLLFVTWQPAEA